jgi:hypothetical protein
MVIVRTFLIKDFSSAFWLLPLSGQATVGARLPLVISMMAV